MNYQVMFDIIQIQNLLLMTNFCVVVKEYNDPDKLFKSEHVKLLADLFLLFSDKDDELFVAEVVDEVEEDIEEILSSTNADPIDFI